jgi:hypothetical protein
LCILLSPMEGSLRSDDCGWLLNITSQLLKMSTFQT